MIARQWFGIVLAESEDAYVEHLRTNTFRAIAALPGFVEAERLRREVPDGVEFQVVTKWRTMDAIRAFAGADLSVAVVPPEAQSMMVRFDERVAYFEVVEHEPLAARSS